MLPRGENKGRGVKVVGCLEGQERRNRGRGPRSGCGGLGAVSHSRPRLGGSSPLGVFCVAGCTRAHPCSPPTSSHLPPQVDEHVFANFVRLERRKRGLGKHSWAEVFGGVDMGDSANKKLFNEVRRLLRLCNTNSRWDPNG